MGTQTRGQAQENNHRGTKTPTEKSNLTTGQLHPEARMSKAGYPACCSSMGRVERGAPGRGRPGNAEAPAWGSGCGPGAGRPGAGRPAGARPGRLHKQAGEVAARVRSRHCAPWGHRSARRDRPSPLLPAGKESMLRSRLVRLPRAGSAGPLGTVPATVGTRGRSGSLGTHDLPLRNPRTSLGAWQDDGRVARRAATQDPTLVLSTCSRCPRGAVIHSCALRGPKPLCPVRV